LLPCIAADKAAAAGRAAASAAAQCIKPGSRLEQIRDWLAEDKHGALIILDECHKVRAWPAQVQGKYYVLLQLSCVWLRAPSTTWRGTALGMETLVIRGRCQPTKSCTRLGVSERFEAAHAVAPHPPSSLMKQLI
jgi:hypothetical protein